MTMNKSTALAIVRTMVKIRKFEQSVSTLFRKAELAGFVHMSLGQESVAAAACAALQPQDYITSTHRGHGQCIAKGAELKPMMAELFAKATGMCGGKGGSMHIADVRLGILGANGIVGAGLGIGLGGAFGRDLLGSSGVSVSFIGDGACNVGLFHEAMNIAAIWKLPYILIVENNQWTEMSPSKDLMSVQTVAERAAAYGIPGVRITDDVESIFDAVTQARRRALEGEGPSIIECVTHRWHGHYEGDSQKYRTKEEVLATRSADALRRFVERCQQLGYLSADEFKAIELETDAEVAAAIEFSRNSPDPTLEEALQTAYV
ncbi:MAG TPA: thiamine pyrophosphate-dependent dehydrogenase E1 component subunit alpha [Steroidobacter sp.]|uniref:thiamine pyrophosphate-dependent dehydrogenase E1 component subunit alpha n=1 Tax=Steroidobacter sp. TaxID=1978227 RepID=UPI002EDB25E6